MQKTHWITLDMGVLGEQVDVAVIAEYHPPCATTMESGKPMDDDTGDYWTIHNVHSVTVPTLDRLRLEHSHIDEAIGDALREQA